LRGKGAQAGTSLSGKRSVSEVQPWKSSGGSTPSYGSRHVWYCDWLRTHPCGREETMEDEKDRVSTRREVAPAISAPHSMLCMKCRWLLPSEYSLCPDFHLFRMFPFPYIPSEHRYHLISPDQIASLHQYRDRHSMHSLPSFAFSLGWERRNHLPHRPAAG